MAQSTIRRRGTGSCPTGVERPDGSPVDGVRPCASALAVSVLLASVLGTVAANRAVTTVVTTAYIAGGPPEPAAPRLIDYGGVTPRRTDSSNSRDGAPVNDGRVGTASQRRLAQSLIYAGGAALVIAGSGLLLVGVRRRLW